MKNFSAGARSLVRNFPLFAKISLLALAVLALSSCTPTETGSIPNQISEQDHVKGNSKAAVILVEYSDFQCPACKAWAPLVSQASKEFGEKVAFVYRHFPLDGHVNSRPAARAAEAAALQGKFWEMHDALFAGQTDWSTQTDLLETFVAYGEKIGLDLEKFKTDFESDTLDDLVDSYYREALRLNLPGTPTFFLNGNPMQSPDSYEAFRRILQDAIKLSEAGPVKAEAL